MKSEVHIEARQPFRAMSRLEEKEKDVCFQFKVKDSVTDRVANMRTEFQIKGLNTSHRQDEGVPGTTACLVTTTYPLRTDFLSFSFDQFRKRLKTSLFV